MPDFNGDSDGAHPNRFEHVDVIVRNLTCMVDSGLYLNVVIH